MQKVRSAHTRPVTYPRRLRWFFVVLLPVVAACSPTLGCEEARFTLAKESRLPRWFNALPDTPRDAVTVQMVNYTSFLPSDRSRTAVFTLRDQAGSARDEARGWLYGHRPLSLDPSNDPRGVSYEIVTVGEVSEVIEHRGPGPTFYVVDDPELRQRVESLRAASEGARK